MRTILWSDAAMSGAAASTAPRSRRAESARAFMRTAYRRTKRRANQVKVASTPRHRTKTVGVVFEDAGVSDVDELSGSALFGLTLDRSVTNLLRRSNQNGAPSETASAVISHPSGL